MGKGLKFSLKGEYRPMTISPLNPRICWEPEFQYALREIAGDTYPQADYVLGGNDPHVVFTKLNLGVDALWHSRSYDQRRPSPSEVARVQEQIEQIHALAHDPAIPRDRREFFRNLQLPNPRYMPECWRTTGFFRKRLHVLWGLSKGGKSSMFLPASANAGDWDDKSSRVSLGEALGVPPAATGRYRGTVGGDGAGTVGGDGARSGGVGTGPFGGRRRDGCLGSMFKWLLGLLLFALIASLFRGCPRGCAPGLGGGIGCRPGRGNLPASVSGADGRDADGDGDADETPPTDAGTDEASPPVTDRPLSEPQENVSSLDAALALACRFRVNPPKELPGSNEEVAKVEFSVSPIDDIGEKEYEVSDWRINDDVKQPSLSASFIPRDGLRYDKAYTISATVVMDGNPQRVEPFQWNTVDAPTWQILEAGHDGVRGMRQYKLVCCNSSSVRPKVRDWKVSFLAKDKDGEKTLDFEVISNRVGDAVFEMRKNIGFFEGSYFMEMTADIDYEIRGKAKSATHVETFPFTHDSSAEGLTKAKYEVVIPNVYFCLAKMEDGTLLNGTAFAISEKLLLSNYHVAVGGIPECYANSGDYKVVGPLTLTNVKGKTFYAKVDRSDRGRDLAILRLCDRKGNDTDDRLPGYLHLAEDALVAGIRETSARHVFAVGYPKGTVCMGPPAFTDGKAEKIVKRDYDWRGSHQAFDTILNYASTKCGYSGGPLVDYGTSAVLGVNFGGLIEKMEGHKAASLATSAAEVRRAFSDLKTR